MLGPGVLRIFVAGEKNRELLKKHFTSYYGLLRLADSKF